MFIQPVANQESKGCGGTVETRAFNHTNTVVWREKEEVSARCAEEVERDQSKSVEGLIIKKFILHRVLKLMRSRWSCLTMGVIWVSVQGSQKLFWAKTYWIVHCFLLLNTLIIQILHLKELPGSLSLISAFSPFSAGWSCLR